MAGTVPPIPAIEYVRIHDLPSALPEELRDQVLFSRVNFLRASKAPIPSNASGTASTSASPPGSRSVGGSGSVPQKAAAVEGARSGGKGGGTGFNFSKALKGALDDAGSSVHSRGDGKFADGQDFTVSDAPGGRAKMVHLTPDALKGDNAERTLAELDRLQQLAGARQRAGAPSTSGAPTATRPPARSTQAQYADIAAAAASVLYDLSDDAGGTAAAANSTAAASGSGTSGPQGGSAAAGAPAPTPQGQGEAAAAGLRVPEYSLREVPEDDGPSGQAGPRRRFEVCVSLPEATSPAEVEVWLAGGGGVLQVSVPGKYGLKLDLPCPVVDDTSQAKWSKARRRLTLILTKADKK